METTAFQVLMEVKQQPPDSGPFRVEAHFSGEVNVPPIVARRRAMGFVGMEILMAVRRGEEVIKPSPEEITAIRDRANAIVIASR